MYHAILDSQTFFFPLLDTHTLSCTALAVALISATIGEYRHAVEESPAWNANDEKIMAARAAIWNAAGETILIFSVLIVACAVTICLLTQPLDQNMIYILNGISRMLAAVVLGQLSIRIALVRHVTQSFPLASFH